VGFLTDEETRLKCIYTIAEFVRNGKTRMNLHITNTLYNDRLSVTCLIHRLAFHIMDLYSSQKSRGQNQDVDD
jgi:hypothetical protein